MVKLPHSALEVLEARIAPATFHWATNGDGNWNDPANWFNETTNTAGDGFPNAPGDVAMFVDVLEGAGNVRIPDGVTITVGAIRFNDDFGYRIIGEGTGKLFFPGPGSISDLGGNTATHEILAPIVLGNGVKLGLAQSSAAPLILSGSISGSGPFAGIEKTGAGTVRLSGSNANTYHGPTTVLWGTLELGKTNGQAVPGSLTIADQFKDLPATVRLLYHNQIADLPLEVHSTGTLDLNGFNETIGKLTLRSGTTAGSTISTGAGTLRLGDLFHTLDGNGTFGARISGKIDLGASSRDFTVANGLAAIDLLIDADITATSGTVLGKEGVGHLQLNGTNTLTNGPEGHAVFVYNGTPGVADLEEIIADTDQSTFQQASESPFHRINAVIVNNRQRIAIHRRVAEIQHQRSTQLHLPGNCKLIVPRSRSGTIQIHIQNSAQRYILC